MAGHRMWNVKLIASASLGECSPVLAMLVLGKICSAVGWGAGKGGGEKTDLVEERRWERLDWDKQEDSLRFMRCRPRYHVKIRRLEAGRKGAIGES